MEHFAESQVEPIKEKRPLWTSPFMTAFFAVMLLVFIFWSKPPYTLAFDPSDEKCLPDFNLGLLHHKAPKVIAHNDLLFFEPKLSLSYLHSTYVLKKVAGIPGDKLSITAEGIKINGSLVATGLVLRKLYGKTEAQFYREEIIPAGKLFMIGEHPNSDDSRYWGYLDSKAVIGSAKRLM